MLQDIISHNNTFDIFVILPFFYYIIVLFMQPSPSLFIA